MQERRKCIVILSSKSSGSSALQDLLCQDPSIRHIGWTRHNENETLFWVKAASVLGLPQVNMADSEVPIPVRRARREIVEMLTRNLDGGYRAPSNPRELIFGGWDALCSQFAPVFLEKSPHNLHQRSALGLLLECDNALEDVDFHFVGLVRNPMDVLYSMWRRRREIPEVHQHEWREAYENLRWLRDERPDQVSVVRYEDLVDGHESLMPVCAFAGVDVPEPGYIHGRSIARWRFDGRFGFALDPAVVRLAGEYGYRPEELDNEPGRTWPVYRQLLRLPYRAVRPARLWARAARKRMRER